jgi:DNA-binding response OmpR family regulator
MSKKHRILVVDDDPAMINLVIYHFEQLDQEYEFLQARDGEAGYKVAMKEQPDLIILDWEMPGLTGIDMLNLLKKDIKTATIPVIMVTGVMTTIENLLTAFDAGAIDYIQKPVNQNELIARARSMLMLSDSYKQIIELKKKELLSNATHLMQYNELSISLLKDIKEISLKYGTNNKQLDEALMKLISKLSSQTKENAWNRFEEYYQQVDPRFFSKLTEKYPNLTPSEIKLASLLKLNLDTKEIASITFQDPNSVRVARARLRKKLNLGQGENLTTFLISIG